MDFLGKCDRGDTFDVFRSNGFNDICLQEFVDSVTEVCALSFCKLPLAWNFLRESCAFGYEYSVLGTRYRYDFANGQRETVCKLRQ